MDSPSTSNCIPKVKKQIRANSMPETIKMSIFIRKSFRNNMKKRRKLTKNKKIKKKNKKMDWIYIDPSRRNESKGKVFMLKDCLPNVPENLDFYFGFAPNIMIKTAPLLDITRS
jgi:hypothetical protein